MIIEQAVHDALVADATVLGLVSTRIYYIKAPQSVTNPYIAIQKISAPRLHTHSGSSGLVNSRFQLTIFATTYKGCKDIAVAIQAVLDNFVGTLATLGMYVGNCLYDNETDLPFDDDLKLYGLAVDYLIWHNE